MDRPKKSFPSLFSLDATRPELCGVSPVSKSHQTYGSFSFLGGNLGSSHFLEVLRSKLSALLRGDRSFGACSILPQRHVALSSRRCPPLQNLPREPQRSHRMVSAVFSWQHYFICRPFNRFAQAYALQIREPMRTDSLLLPPKISETVCGLVRS